MATRWEWTEVRPSGLAAVRSARGAAENLFLRKHLAMYVERQVKPRRADDATRFWRWKSRPCGRPRLRADVQRLIVEMAVANRTWGEEHRVRAPREAGYSRVAADSAALHADRSSTAGGHRNTA